ncbi:SprB repeat-containing protein, partial [Algivirga pacifica]|uniref:SprB repeat-containing protein n=1 Tax=Algivirga pacifica TaxID=1162670 RepID=UPI0031E80EFD
MMNYSLLLTKDRRVPWLYGLFVMLFCWGISSSLQAQSFNLDQYANDDASLSSGEDWVNGNLNESKSHYVEGYSIPYRVVMTGLTNGLVYTLTLGFDITAPSGGYIATDYITSYQNLEPHTAFGHAAEVVDPTEGVMGLSGMPDSQIAIGAPPVNSTPVAGEPTNSFNAQPASQKLISMWGGTLSAVVYDNTDGQYSVDGSETQFTVTFTATGSTAILAFGGHISNRFDWGFLPGGDPRSASGITGSPYHMRLIGATEDGNFINLGNQDRSLKASAVAFFPTCDIIGDSTNCDGENMTFTLEFPDDEIPNGFTAEDVYDFEWEIINNNTGASIVGSNTADSVIVDPGNMTGTFEIQVTITDEFSGGVSVCSKVVTVGSLLLSGIVTDVSCDGDEDGAIDLTVSDGSGFYSYSWSNGETTQDIDNLPAGQYIVTVTDDTTGCVAMDTFIVDTPDALLASGTVTNVDCNGDSTGSIDVSVSGGTPSYTYLWTPNGETTQDLTNLAEGMYSVKITDADGCDTTLNFTITEPDAILLESMATDALCNGDSGAISGMLSGGTPPYSIEVTDGNITKNFTDVDPGAIGPILLPAGTYTVTVTDSLGCTAMKSETINEPDALDLLCSADSTKCFGDSTGVVSVDVSGGTPSYNYLWKDANQVQVGATQEVTGLPAGVYTVIVTDQNQCEDSCSVEVFQPQALVLQCEADSALCNGDRSGSVNVEVQGGTAPYTYAWTDAQDNPVGMTQMVANLPAGTYKVVVTDQNNCKDSCTAEVFEVDALELSCSADSALCNGESSGSVKVEVQGGTGMYTYAWTDAQDNPVGSTAMVSNLPAGTYKVVVMDENDCTDSCTTVIEEPAVLELSCSADSALCNGESSGSVKVEVQGGTGMYTYAWTDAQDNPVGSTAMVSDLPAGMYKVVVMDENDCTDSCTAIIEEPAALELSCSADSALCNGESSGSVKVEVQGGTGMYTYAWTDAQDNPVGSTAMVSNLPAGTYKVVVMDENDCTDSCT